MLTRGQDPIQYMSVHALLCHLTPSFAMEHPRRPEVLRKSNVGPEVANLAIGRGRYTGAFGIIGGKQKTK